MSPKSESMEPGISVSRSKIQRARLVMLSNKILLIFVSLCVTRMGVLGSLLKEGIQLSMNFISSIDSLVRSEPKAAWLAWWYCLIRKAGLWKLGMIVLMFFMLMSER